MLDSLEFRVSCNVLLLCKAVIYLSQGVVLKQKREENFQSFVDDRILCDVKVSYMAICY